MSIPIKIALIEDDKAIRVQYGNYFAQSKVLECVFAAESLERFFKFYNKKLGLEVILLDLKLPGMSGMDGIRVIKSKMPDIDIVVFTKKQDYDTIFKAFRLGATGYLIKGMTKSELEKQLMSIKNDGAPISPVIAKRLVEYFNPPKQFLVKPKKSQLTKKQKQILNLLIKGLTYEKIADHINISLNGVRYHIKHIYSKLQVNSRSEVLKKYFDDEIELN